MKFQTGVLKKLSISILAVVLVSSIGFAPTAHAGSPSSVGYYYSSSNCQSAWYYYPNLYNYNSTAKQDSNYSYGPGAFCLAVSGSSYYKAVFQTDGNLVVYKSTNGSPLQATWSSGTAGMGATRLTFQTDGNMVIYRSYTALWHSNTYNRMVMRAGNPPTINMQTDGNLVIYDVNRRPYWSTLTGPIYY